MHQSAKKSLPNLRLGAGPSFALDARLETNSASASRFSSCDWFGGEMAGRFGGTALHPTAALVLLPVMQDALGRLDE